MGYVLLAFVCGVLVRPMLIALLVWFDASRVLRIDIHTRARRQEKARGEL